MRMSGQRPIGLIDSGVGGLSVWEAIVRELPGESTVYVGDQAFVPYSNKSSELITDRVSRLVQFLLAHQAKLIVLACNTATVAALEAIRLLYKEVPLVGVVPVVKTAAEQSRSHHFAVLSTMYTANSPYQRRLIDTFAANCRVESIPCPVFVDDVERGDTDSAIVESHARDLLGQIRGTDIDTVVLGCTHFPFLRPVLQRVVGENVRLLDSGGAVARQVRRVLTHNGTLADGAAVVHEWFTTGDPVSVSSAATGLLRQAVRFAHLPATSL